MVKADLTFLSLSEMIERADRPEVGRIGRSSRTGSARFTGTESWSECKEVALAGYDDIRPQVDEMVPAVLADLDEVMQPDMLPLYDVAGGAVDIGRFLSNEPECMVDYSLQDVPADRLVRVIVASAVAAAESKKDIMTRGAAVVALVEALATAKYSTELWIEYTVGAGTTRQHTILTRIKNADEPLDINAFMFAAAHPSYQRRVVFGVQETVPEQVRRKFGFGGGGYGFPPYHLTMTDSIGAHVAVDAMDRDRRPCSDPASWLKDQIRKIQSQG